jgi:flagellar operon protein
MEGIKGAGSAAEFLIDRLGQGGALRPEKASESISKGDGAQPFSEVLKDRIGTGAPRTGELKFSAHAQQRMQSRGIDLSPDELVKLHEAVERCRDKGSKESLILTERAAFVVSVKNDTVITAVDRASLKDNVFTNIDSTVLL